MLTADSGDRDLWLPTKPITHRSAATGAMARLNALLVGGTAIVCAFRGARRACVRCSLWPKVSVAVLRPSDSGPWSTSSLRHRQWAAGPYATDAVVPAAVREGQRPRRSQQPSRSTLRSASGPVAPRAGRA